MVTIGVKGLNSETLKPLQSRLVCLSEQEELRSHLATREYIFIQQLVQLLDSCHS